LQLTPEDILIDPHKKPANIKLEYITFPGIIPVLCHLVPIFKIQAFAESCQ